MFRNSLTILWLNSLGMMTTPPPWKMFNKTAQLVYLSNMANMVKMAKPSSTICTKKIGIISQPACRLAAGLSPPIRGLGHPEICFLGWMGWIGHTPYTITSTKTPAVSMNNRLWQRKGIFECIFQERQGEGTETQFSDDNNKTHMDSFITNTNNKFQNLIHKQYLLKRKMVTEWGVRRGT